MFTRLGAALAAAFLMAGGSASAPAFAAPAAPHPVSTLEQCVTLSQLGVNAVDATHLTRTGEIKTFAFTMPDGATQGPSDWYVIHFHVRVTVPTHPTGTALVTAETDGKTDAQIEYKMSSTGTDWSTVSIAQPYQEEHTTSRTTDVRVANYLQDSGVRGGPNTGAFRVELDDGAKLDDVQILDDTCIERTALSPELVQIDSQTAPSVTHRGDSVTVRLRLTNDGTRPITKVNATLTPADNGLKATSPTTVSTTNMPGVWIAEFHFTALQVGSHPVHVDVSSALTPALSSQMITVVVQKGSTPAHVPWQLGALIAVLIVGVTWALVRFTRGGRSNTVRRR